MSKWYSVHVHLLNPLPVPRFYHFYQWRQKAHRPLINTAFLLNSSDFSAVWSKDPANSKKNSPSSSNVCAHITLRKYGSASGQVYGSDQIVEYLLSFSLFFFIFFILKIIKIQRSPYAHFNFMTLCINTNVPSPMYWGFSVIFKG